LSHGVALHAACQRRAHFADVVRVLPVRLLRAAPRRVPQEVHVDAAEEVRAAGAQLQADRLADALFQVRVPGRAARHAHGEASVGADDDAARPVGEGDAGEAEAFDCGAVVGAAHVAVTGDARDGSAGHANQAGPEVLVAVEAVELLLEGQSGYEFRGDYGRALAGAPALARPVEGKVAAHQSTRAE
jgi:hypothetical protein